MLVASLCILLIFASLKLRLAGDIIIIRCIDKVIVNGFVIFLLGNLLLVEHFIKAVDSNEARDAIYGGGLRIYTAVDLDVQKTAEDIYVNRKGFEDRKNAQSAITIMDYKGRVVAIVGQAGVKEGNRVLNRASSSPRSPGSSIKPLSVYGPAMDLGLISPSSLIL